MNKPRKRKNPVSDLIDFVKSDGGHASLTVEFSPGRDEPNQKAEKNFDLPVVDGGVGTVGFSFGVTINIGNYQSVKMDAWADGPYKEGDRDQAMADIRRFVLSVLGRETDELKQRLKSGEPIIPRVDRDDVVSGDGDA